MKQSVVDGINGQIKDEIYSGYLYLAMSAHFGAENLEGFSRWMRLQAQEELQHAMRLYDYVLQAGGRIVLHGIDQPPAEFGSPLSIFQQALEHEKEVTKRIHALYHLARSESDYPTELALQWFVEEQVQEEDNAARAVDQLERAGDNKAALLMLDGQFGARVSTE